MPLREDLLTPIAGENPSGLDLYYDRVFDQIKEARREDSDDLPGGVWEAKEKKKADHRAVIKLAGEALATKSKDLRLLGWLVESHLKIDGLSVLVPGIELLHALQEAFWPTFYPPIEEGDDLELRMLSVEAAARLMIATVRKLPLTKYRVELDWSDHQQQYTPPASFLNTQPPHQKEAPSTDSSTLDEKQQRHHHCMRGGSK